MYFSCLYHSPLGELTLASDGEALTGLWMEGQKHFAQHHSDPTEDPGLPIFTETAQWLDQYFAGNIYAPIHIPIHPAGTPFQQQVWQILSTVPPGQTITYGQIAKLLGNPGASQAVGGAVGRNPISILVPCHRVLGTDGKLTGYAGGLPRKVWLLRHEGILIPTEADRILSALVL